MVTNGKVRDLKRFNDRLQREVHLLPKVDETLACLTGANVFSKLDADSSFWELIKVSHLSTTRNTSSGRYNFHL